MMMANLITLLLAFVVSPLASAVSIPPPAPRSIHVHPRAEQHNVTPHDKYSSSIGVLGCKIDINRVAYWPDAVDCDNICVKVTNPNNSVSVTLLRIDQSGGAHDISYDAWNMLNFGVSAEKEENRHYGGSTGPFDIQYVNADECKPLIKTPDGKLPFAAANSMHFITSCKARNTWVGNNFQFYNINDPRCQYGEDVTCDYPDLSKTNQPDCGGPPHILGNTNPLPPQYSVSDIAYPTSIPGSQATAPPA